MEETVGRYFVFLQYIRSRMMTGNDFLNDLSTGKAKMSEEPGMAAEFMSDIGKYFQPGFSTTDGYRV